MSNKLTLGDPEQIHLTLGDVTKTFDLFKVRRVLADAETQPNEERRWAKVNEWLAAELGVLPERLAESTAIAVQLKVSALVKEANERLKKSIDSTVSSQPSTLESPTTSSPGT